MKVFTNVLPNCADKNSTKKMRCRYMYKENLFYNTETTEKNFFLEEMMKNSHSFVEVLQEKTDLPELELISKVEEPYVSPIFSMSEEEILNFVEEFEVNELATLSNEELEHIGNVLGVDLRALAQNADEANPEEIEGIETQ